MIQKEEALLVLKARVASLREELALATFIRNPTIPVEKDAMPAIFMIEGIDHITSYNNRGGSWYPVQRVAEVVFEIIVTEVVDDTRTDIKFMYRKIRSALMINIHPLILENGKVNKKVFFREVRTEGPSGYGIPDVVGMRLVLELFYTDKGQ